MEKQRTDRFIDRRIGLLIHRIILIIAIASLFCANVAAQNFFSDERIFSYDEQKFMIAPETENISVGDEVVFSVFVPDVLSADVQILAPDFGDDVNFLILRSFDFFVQGRRGVRVELKLSFNRDGNFQLPPLTMVLRGMRHDIPFAIFYVSKNLSALQPKMVVRFERANDGRFLGEIYDEENYARPIFSVETGTQISVQVILKNAKSLERISWVLPEHALFSQTEQHEKSAAFEWIPLMARVEQIPAFTVAVVANDGNAVELRSPAATVNVTAALVDEIAASSDTSFPNAFALDDTANSEIQQTSQMTREECENLASSLFQEKKRFRLAMNIFIAAVVLAMALFVYCIVLSKKKKQTVAIIAIVVIFAVACVGAIFCVPRAMSRTGVFLGGNVSAIPESISAQSVFLDAGQIVRVVQTVGDWCFIKCDAASGWVLTETIIEK